MRIFIPFFYTFVLVIFHFGCTPKVSQIIVPKSSEPSTSTTIAASEVLSIPVNEDVLMGKLHNGMTYYIQKNGKPENRAELRLVVKVGSIVEDDDQQGLAHFVEHMAFNGTTSFEKNELVNYLETTGSRFGPDLNAYTSFDETVYMLQIRTDSMALFDKGVLILKEWASEITFDDKEIDKERGVITAEWRSRLSPDQRMQNVYFPIMYQGSQYAKRLPIGEPAIIDTAYYETLKRYYRDWYRPELMAVVVVGDIDIHLVEDKIQGLFNEIPISTSDVRVRPDFTVPGHKETLVSVVGDVEASFTQVQVLYKHPEFKVRDQQDYRTSITHNLYNTMMGARLQELTQTADPPFMFAFSGYGSNVGDIDTYSAFAFVPEGKSLVALESVLTENQRVLQHGFTAGELERGKMVLKERIETAAKESDKTESARLAMRYVSHFLREIPIPSPIQTLKLYDDLLPTIELSDVNVLAAQWIRNQNQVIVITGPIKEQSPLPDENQVREILDRVKNNQVAAYQDDVSEAPFFSENLDLRPFMMKYVDVDNDSEENAEVTLYQFNSGLKVYTKKTNFKNDEILMTATSDGGTSLYGDHDYPSASNCASVIRESGLGDFSQVQLTKLLAGKKASVFPYVAGLSEGFNGSSSPEDLELMFQMIYQFFKNPRVDEEAFTSYITKEKGFIQNLMSNPNFFFSDFVSRTVYNNHPRTGFPNIETMDRINFERSIEIYKERFADASDFVFAFVGNFDEEIMESLISKYLGNLPVIDRKEKWNDVGIRAVRGGLKKRIKRGQAPRTTVNLQFHGDFEFDDDNSYVLTSAIDYLRIKLREAMREDLGGVYGVGISGGGSKKPYENYSITVSFNADPPMTDTLVATAHQVIAKAISEGPNEIDLVKVKETQRQSRIKDLKENRFWLNTIIREQEQGAEFKKVLLENFDKKINRLSSEDIRKAIAHYFNYDNYIEIIMDPEE